MMLDPEIEKKLEDVPDVPKGILAFEGGKDLEQWWSGIGNPILPTTALNENLKKVVKIAKEYGITRDRNAEEFKKFKEAHGRDDVVLMTQYSQVRVRLQAKYSRLRPYVDESAKEFSKLDKFPIQDSRPGKRLKETLDSLKLELEAGGIQHNKALRDLQNAIGPVQRTSVNESVPELPGAESAHELPVPDSVHELPGAGPAYADQSSVGGPAGQQRREGASLRPQLSRWLRRRDGTERGKDDPPRSGPGAKPREDHSRGRGGPLRDV